MKGNYRSRSKPVSVLFPPFGLLVLIVITIAMGCVTPKVNGAPSDTLSAVDGPCKPVDYKKTGASAKVRPPWVMVEPHDAGGLHFLVGMSGYHATERDARDEAMRHAREEFAKYTGVEVTELDQMAKEIYGTSSAILDPTVIGKTLSTQETNALVSRTKAKEWYYEILRGSCGERDLGAAYQYWVLAEVPVEEYDRVQTWKAKKEAAKEAEKSTERDRIKGEIGQVISSHKEALAEAEVLIAKAEPVAALTVLQGDWNRLYDATKAIETREGIFPSEISQLKSLQWAIPPVIQRVRSPLVIDPGRGGMVWVASDFSDDPADVPVWVWYKQGNGIKPVSGIPVVLKESDGEKIIARGTTNPSGQALLGVKDMDAGNYTVSIDPQGGAMASLSPPLQEVMTSVGTTVSVKSYKPDLPGAAKAGVYELFKGPSLKPLPAAKVVMGSVRYSDSRLGSELGKRMETLLEREISQVSDISLIRRQTTRSIEAMVQTDRTRGIGMTDAPVPPMNSPAIQAKLDGAEAILEASYSLERTKVNIDFSLVQAGTGQVLAAAGATIDRSLIPGDLQMMPPSSVSSITPVNTGKPGEIHLELTTQRGDGATFAKGEKIQYFVSSNRDAYLLLLYKDAEDHLIQIYPNSRSGTGFHKAGEYIAIPDETMSFDFTITPPFGVEQVLAFASTAPFPNLKGKGLSNGLMVLDGSLNNVASQLRTHDRKAGASYGETNVVVTTVKD